MNNVNWVKIISIRLYTCKVSDDRVNVLIAVPMRIPVLWFLTPRGLVYLPTFWKNLLPQTSGHCKCVPPNLLPRSLGHSKRVPPILFPQISVHSNRALPNLLAQISGHSTKSTFEIAASTSKNLTSESAA